MSASSTVRPTLAATVGRSTLSVLALFVVLALIPPALRGTPLPDAIRMGAFLLAFVAVPGALAYQHLCGDDEDALMSAGMAWTLGYCLQILAYLACKVVGLAPYFGFYPALALLVFVGLRVARASPHVARASSAPRLRELAPFCVLLVIVLGQTPYYPAAEWMRVLDDDLMFHAGNAAELRNNWPLEDPRCAGLPLVYHIFAYALPASASAVTHLSIRDTMYGVGAFVGPIFLALQIYNAARLYARTHFAGLIAAAIVLLHVDYGRALESLIERSLGEDRRSGWLGFSSDLDIGVYTSASTASGFLLMATLAILVHRWFAVPGWIRARTIVLVACVAFAASGVKSSIMPVVVGGVALFLAQELVLRRTLQRRALALLGILAAAAAPVSLYLASGRQSFAATMFRWDPGSVIRNSPSFAAVARHYGIAPDGASLGWLAAALPFWLVGYLDLIGVGALVYVLCERFRLSASASVLLWSAACGGAMALSLSAPGNSELFFLYTGQVGLAILAGAGLAALARTRGVGARTATIVLGILALPIFVNAFENARRLLITRPIAAPASAAAYREGLEFVRRELPPNAVIIAAHPGMLVSALAERRSFYETDRFTPQAHELGWSLEQGRWKHSPAVDRAFPERLALRKRCFSPRPAGAVAEAKALVAPASPVYVLYDALSYTRDAPSTEAEPATEPTAEPAAEPGGERTPPRRPKGKQGARTEPASSRTLGSRALGTRARGDSFLVAPRAPPADSPDTAAWTSVFSNDVMHCYRVDPP